MYGLKAINAYNGWAMAVVGAIIVFLGLTILSFAISQIHKILAFMESKKARDVEPLETVDDECDGGIPMPVSFSNDPVDIALYYQPLTEQLGEPFQLAALYGLCQKHRIPHTHLSIRRLREAGMLVPEGDGWFRWNVAFSPLGPPGPE